MRAIAGAVAWMIAAAFQIIPNTWPSLLVPHPWVVATFLLVGAAMFAYAAVGNKRTEGAMNSVGRDNSGPQIYADRIHAGRDVIFAGSPGADRRHGDTIQDSQTVSARSVLDVIPAKTGKGLSPDVSGPDIFTAALQLNVWQRARVGHRCAFVWITNSEAKPGQIGADLRSIFATISFNEEDKVLAHVSRAFWLSHATNQINICIGERKALLLGSFHDRIWTVFENRLECMPRRLSGFTLPMPGQQSFYFDNLLKINVSLVCGDTGETIKRLEVEIRDTGEEEMEATLRQNT